MGTASFLTLEVIRMADNHVRPKTALSKTRVAALLAAGFARVSAGRKGEFADKLEVKVRTVDRALTGDTTPEFHTAINALLFDITALDEVMRAVGCKITPNHSQAANDMELAAGLSHGLSEFIDRLRDGRRCHIDTAVLAELFRQIIPQMQAIVDEADHMRGAA